MAGLPAHAHAQETRTGLLASSGVSVETNPYNASDSSGAEFAANLELRPTLSIDDGNTDVELRGLAQFRQFLRRYGLEDNYGIDGQIVSRRSDRVTLRASGLFSYSEGGFNGYGRPGLSAADPIGSSLTDPTSTAPADQTVTTPTVSLQNPLTALTDVNILGQRTRLTSIDTVVGADVKLNAISSLSADFKARALRFQAAAYQNYNVLGGELRYSRSLNELVSIGLIGDYDRTNYLNPAEGDASVMSALASLDRRFGARWTASLAAGASFTDIDGRSGLPGLHYTTLAARVRFCRQGEFSRLCLSGERSPQPAVNGNVRISDAVNADYSLRLSQRERFSLFGSYARTGRGRDPATGVPAIEFASGTARYDNDFDRRLTAFATASISKIYSPVAPRRANIGGAIGLQVHLGAPR